MKSIVEGVDGQVDTMSALGDGSKMALIEVEEGSELEAAAELECEDKVLFVQPNYIYELEEDESPDELTENENAKELTKDESVEPEEAEETRIDLNGHPNDFYYLRGCWKYMASSPPPTVNDTTTYAGTADVKGVWDKLAALDNQSANPNEKKKPVVAIIDTGVKYNHEDLNGANNQTDPILVDQCVTFNGGKQMGFTDGDGAVDDGEFHGTSVAGVIGARLNNEKGIAGVAGNRVEMFVVDVDTPETGTSHSIDIAKGIYYALDPNDSENGDDQNKKPADLINISLGIYNRDSIVEDALKTALEKEVLCVTSAGNKTTQYMHYPGDSPYVLNVMGHEPLKGEPFEGKENGREYGIGYGVEKDISAPGTNYSTCVDETTFSDKYKGFSGSSGSAAFVTGSAALLLYYKPDLTLREIKNLLYTSTGKESFSAEHGGQGFGRINVNTAMQNLLDSEPYPDNPNNPDNIVINKTSIEMFEGTDTGIEYAIYPGNTNTTDVTFTSSNKDVAEVNAYGVVTAKAPGQTIIKVTCKGLSAQCEVTVNEIPYKTIDRKPYSTEDTFTLTEPNDVVVNTIGSVTTEKSGYSYHQYRINLEKNETISAVMTGTMFCSLLRIKDKEGRVVAVGSKEEMNDIQPKNFHSVVTYTAKQAGAYQIQAMQICNKEHLGTDYDLKLASDRVLCKPKVKSIGNGQMCMSWSAVDNTDYYLVRKYAKYADIAQAKPEIEEKVDATEYTDTAYDKTKANYYTVTACMETNAGVLYNGESKLFIKLKNPLLMKGQKVKVKRKTLKKKSVKLPRSKVIKFTKAAKDKKTYTLLSAKKGKKGFKKYFRINKTTGKVTIKKGLKKGTYKVKVRVKAAGNVKYKTITKDVTFKIKVK